MVNTTDEMPLEHPIVRHLVLNDQGLALTFTGKLLGSAFDSGDNWETSCHLYITQGGKYVCSRIERNDYKYNGKHYECAICETQEQIVKFFGGGTVAMELYDLVKINGSVEVDSLTAGEPKKAN